MIIKCDGCGFKYYEGDKHKCETFIDPKYVGVVNVKEKEKEEETGEDKDMEDIKKEQEQEQEEEKDTKKTRKKPFKLTW